MQWETHDGRRLTPQRMETKHLFNAAKMLYNHLFALTGKGEPIWFSRVWPDVADKCKEDPQRWLWWLKEFVKTLKKRQDMPESFVPHFQKICAVIELKQETVFMYRSPECAKERRRKILLELHVSLKKALPF